MNQSALQQLFDMIGNAWNSFNQPQTYHFHLRDPQVNPTQIQSLPGGAQVIQQQQAPNYQALISAAYQKLGGATPQLEAQIPVMAQAMQQNPNLYPYLAAIPYAETSLGKSMTYPGNFYNLGATMNPYPLTGYSPDYITNRVAYRLNTDPAYAPFRQNPSLQTLQQSYAPAMANPNWLDNMKVALGTFQQPNQPVELPLHVF